MGNSTKEWEFKIIIREGDWIEYHRVKGESRVRSILADFLPNVDLTKIDLCKLPELIAMKTSGVSDVTIMPTSRTVTEDGDVETKWLNPYVSGLPVA